MFKTTNQTIPLNWNQNEKIHPSNNSIKSLSSICSYWRKWNKRSKTPTKLSSSIRIFQQKPSESNKNQPTLEPTWPYLPGIPRRQGTDELLGARLLLASSLILLAASLDHSGSSTPVWYLAAGTAGFGYLSGDLRENSVDKCENPGDSGFDWG